jgi:hypothetical protein
VFTVLGRTDVGEFPACGLRWRSRGSLVEFLAQQDENLNRQFGLAAARLHDLSGACGDAKRTCSRSMPRKFWRATATAGGSAHRAVELSASVRSHG